MQETIQLRPTVSTDLEFVLHTERHPENRPYILQWAGEQHLHALKDPNIAHLVVERAADSQPVGYVILAGLAEIHESIELARTAFAVKGKGYGRQMLQLVKQWVFEEREANRLWLEVIAHNRRAKRLYISEGFVEEGLQRECIKVDGVLQSMFLLSILRREHLVHSLGTPETGHVAFPEASRLPPC